MLDKIKEVPKVIWQAGLLGFIVGVLWLAAIRFVTYQPDTVHYHANFSLYINGEIDGFDDVSFYEEVQACTDDDLNNPRSRAHMHDMVSHVVHVHDRAVTWGHFFSNLGYNLDNGFVKTDDGLYTDGQDGRKLSFMLNGELTGNVANKIIGDEDVLLISYGDESGEVLSDRYDQITRDAHEYNERDDPSACQGDNEPGFWDKVLYSFGLKQL